MRRNAKRQIAKSTEDPELLADIRRLITEARRHVAGAANATLTMLYWQVGQRIRTAILHQKRAAYGEQIVVSVGRQLSAEYGAGFADKNLRRMLQFAEVFPDKQIVVSLIRQLSWTHFLALLPLKDVLQRDFYAEMCRVQGWSVRMLRAKIGGMLYERTALSRKPAKLARVELAALRDEDRLSTDLVLRDPYLPRVFTEHGAIMAATVLNSEWAIQMSVYVVRAIVELKKSQDANIKVRIARNLPLDAR